MTLRVCPSFLYQRSCIVIFSAVCCYSRRVGQELGHNEHQEDCNETCTSNRVCSACMYEHMCSLLRHNHAFCSCIIVHRKAVSVACKGQCSDVKVCSLLPLQLKHLAKMHAHGKASVAGDSPPTYRSGSMPERGAMPLGPAQKNGHQVRTSSHFSMACNLFGVLIQSQAFPNSQFSRVLVSH